MKSFENLSAFGMAIKNSRELLEISRNLFGENQIESYRDYLVNVILNSKEEVLKEQFPSLDKREMKERIYQLLRGK